MDMHDAGWRCVWPAKAHLGEGSLWDPRDGCIYWLDVEAPAIFRYELASGVQSTWVPPVSVSALALRAGGGFVGSTRDGVAIVDPSKQKISFLSEPRTDPEAARLNDGTVDRHGRYWTGSVDNAVSGGSPSGWKEGNRAALYSVHRNGRTREWDTGFIATNGPAVSPDGRTLYLNDSLARTTYAYSLSSDGELSERRVFNHYGDGFGYPDGMTCYADGDLWIAFFQDDLLRRYAPDGSVRAVFRLPVRQGTRPIFCGSGLERLFLSSASLSFSEGDWRDQPLAGSLFEILNPGAVGAPPVFFEG